MERTLMRLLLTIPLVFGFVGCGSKSPDSETETIGVSLAIGNPSVAGGDRSTTTNDTIAESVTSPAVEQLIKKAQAAVAARQGRLAVEALSQAIGFDPANSQLFHMRADVYALMGEYASARADYSLAIQSDPKNADLHNARGYFLMTRGLGTEALTDFNRALALNPQLAVAWNNRGLIRLAEKDHEAAIADFTKAADLDSNYADALNNRGFAKMKYGQLDAALIDLQQTVRLKPDYTTAWNNCGLVYMQQEKYKEAVAAFSEAVKLSPMDARWLKHRRSAWQKLENFDQANADAQKIRWLEGVSQLTQLASEKPGDPEVWIHRAEHLAKGSEFAAAIQDYSRAIAIQPAHTEALTGRAHACLQSGDAQNAITDCDKALSVERSTAAYSIRGDAWFALADYDKAISDFESAQRLDDSLVIAYQKRAAQRKSEGREDLANEDLKKANHVADALAGRLKQRSAVEQIPFPTN